MSIKDVKTSVMVRYSYDRPIDALRNVFKKTIKNVEGKLENTNSTGICLPAPPSTPNPQPGSSKMSESLETYTGYMNDVIQTFKLNKRRIRNIKKKEGEKLHPFLLIDCEKKAKENSIISKSKSLY